jgi:hypothetical protein
MNRRIASIAALILVATACGPSAHAQSVDAPAALRRADFNGESVSSAVRQIADWAVHSGDHGRFPFIVVDKVNAQLSAFDTNGRLIRSTPVLLGMGVGDSFAPGVTGMNMYETKPWQRVTPAGRYHADEDRNDKGERVLWVDYDNGIAIHKLPAKRTKQRRHERIRSADPAEHRITYGCINVPPSFYDQVVHAHFKGQGGVVYVLPEKAPLKAVFKSYDVDSQVARVHTSTGQASPASTRKF